MGRPKRANSRMASQLKALQKAGKIAKELKPPKPRRQPFQSAPAYCPPMPIREKPAAAKAPTPQPTEFQSEPGNPLRAPEQKLKCGPDGRPVPADVAPPPPEQTVSGWVRVDGRTGEVTSWKTEPKHRSDRDGTYYLPMAEYQRRCKEEEVPKDIDGLPPWATRNASGTPVQKRQPTRKELAARHHQSEQTVTHTLQPMRYLGGFPGNGIEPGAPTGHPAFWHKLSGL